MRIPGPSNLGSATAKPVAPQGVPRGAFGGQVAAATAGLGNTVQDIGGVEMSDELRAAQQQAREREVRREKADQAQALDALQSNGDALQASFEELTAGVLNGTIDKSKAAKLWAERRAKIQTGALKDVPIDHQDAVSRGLTHTGAKLDIALTKVLDERNRTDTRAGLLGYLEGQERAAQTNMAAAVKAADDALSELGPHAGMTAEQVQKAKQGFRERVSNTNAVQRVQADPAKALTFLRDTENLPDLDPDARLRLIATAEAAVLRQQERVRIAQERIAREQDRVFAGASSVFESGRAFSADYAAQVQRQLKGSPYESAVNQMISAGPQNVATATKPIDAQRKELAALYARVNAGGSDPAMNKEIDRRQKVLRESEADAKNDPLVAANARGVIENLAPIDFSNPATLSQQLAERVDAARTAGVWAARPVSPLTQPEAESMAQFLSKLPPDQKAAALAGIGTAVGDKGMLVALAKQIDGKEKVLATALLYADTKTTQGRFVSEIMLRGESGLKDGKVKADPAKESGWRATIANEIGDAYPNEELRQRVIDAAYFVQAGLSAEGKGDVDRAVRLATGGIRTQADGSKVPLPYGWNEDEFVTRLRSMTKDDIGGQGELYAGGQAVSAEKFLAQLPQASLIAVGGGRYVVRAGSGFVTDRGGKRVVLDLK